MKRFKEIMRKYFDDIIYAVGLACVSIGAFKYHPVAGWLALGGGLLVFSFLVARGR